MFAQLQKLVENFAGEGLFFGGEDLSTLAPEFPHEDLAGATDEFDAKNRLGGGTAGEVYHGTLAGGEAVAVKVLSDDVGLSSFDSEVRFLSKVKHPNIVTLLGWAEHEDDDGNYAKYLVYEFVPGGNVSRRLYRSKMGAEAFVWQQRLRVAFDVSTALSFMVNGQTRAFHRDIQASNVLISGDGSARLCDFGLAVTLEQGQRRLTVEDINGAHGYMCPVYRKTGDVTEQSEVFSFGMLLLEFLVNELPAKADAEGQIVYPLTTAAAPWQSGAPRRILHMLDRTAAWPAHVASPLIDLALRCLRQQGEQRPLFANVVSELSLLCHREGVLPQHTPQRSGSPSPIRRQSASFPEHQRPRAASEAHFSHHRGSSDPDYMSRRHSEADLMDGTQSLAVFDRRATKEANPQQVPLTIGPTVHGRRPSREIMSPDQWSVDTRPPPPPAVGSAVATLECVYAHGMEGKMPEPHRRRLSVALGDVMEVGRQRQPGFFERLLEGDPRWLHYISRAHCRLQLVKQQAGYLKGGSGLCLKIENLSMNVVFVSGRKVAKNMADALIDGDTLDFAAKLDEASDLVKFLRFRVRLAS
eukprot:TRINITY_DN35589_c0_g2_i1.p1 TRINITY_DN35589_c0_g2~~TRINITY_DN35589_c0_g2_i1.p1  ORF type:complete len:583 (-),score=137.64 TRINITY_DN35589_c0_g2_i1:124-1872(-)